jgi:hypothetical protein
MQAKITILWYSLYIVSGQVIFDLYEDRLTARSAEAIIFDLISHRLFILHLRECKSVRLSQCWQARPLFLLPTHITHITHIAK